MRPYIPHDSDQVPSATRHRVQPAPYFFEPLSTSESDSDSDDCSASRAESGIEPWVRPDNCFGTDDKEAMAEYEAECVSHKRQMAVSQGGPHRKRLATQSVGSHYVLHTNAPMFISAFHARTDSTALETAG